METGSGDQLGGQRLQARLSPKYRCSARQGGQGLDLVPDPEGGQSERQAALAQAQLRA